MTNYVEVVKEIERIEALPRWHPERIELKVHSWLYGFARRRRYTAVYLDLRDDGGPRIRSWLLASGWWAYWPIRLGFPEVDSDDILPTPRSRH